MGGVFFLATFLCLAVVIVWFIRNEDNSGGGHIGLLALRSSQPKQNKPGEPAARYTMGRDRHAIEKNLGELDHVRHIAAENAHAENQGRAFRKKEGVAFNTATTRRHKTKKRVTPAKRRQS